LLCCLWSHSHRPFLPCFPTRRSSDLDRLVRGRMDAVFHDPEDDVYEVVDWKTGRLPATERERRAAAVQLAAYRVAWARIADIPRSEEHTSELQSRENLVCRLLLEKKK